MELLKKMFGQSQTTQPSMVASGFIAHKGNLLSPFNVKSELSNVWIVDLGALHHMTRDITLLTKFDQYHENWTIKLHMNPYQG